MKWNNICEGIKVKIEKETCKELEETGTWKKWLVSCLRQIKVEILLHVIVCILVGFVWFLSVFFLVGKCQNFHFILCNRKRYIQTLEIKLIN